MSKGKSEYSTERDRELLKVFGKLLGSGVPCRKAMAVVATSPCSRFYISPENAYRRIRLLLTHGHHTHANHRMKQIIADIMERCAGDYSYLNVERVVFSPAPSFYLTCGSARKIIERSLKRQSRHLRPAATP